MYVGKDFSPSDPGEEEPYTLNFRRDVADGETVATAAWTCSVADGVDDAAAGHIVGSPTNSGTKTTQRVEGLAAGVKYVLQAVVTTSAGNTVSLWSHVICTAPH